ncbi:nucleotide-binding protein [Streptomyces violaceus]
MPSGDNWQNDVLRDLRGGAPQQRAVQQGGQPPQASQQAQEGTADQYPPGQGQGPAPGPAPAYGYPQQYQQSIPSDQQHAQQPMYAEQYAARQQGYPQQGRQPYPDQAYAHQAHAQQQAYAEQRAYAEQQTYAEQYAVQQQASSGQTQTQSAQQNHNHNQPQQYAEPAPAPRARTSRSAPDSRPVVEKKLLGADKGPRRGEPFAARALRAVRRTIASSASREVAETTATAETLQQPVTTGRQIAVTSIRGGSGKTTVAALLTATYAHYRQDPVLAIEADPALGSLPLRLGAESLRWTTGDLADVVEPQMTLLDITGYLVQLPENAWLLPGSQGQVGAMLDTKGYERIMVAMRRYFGVTVADCETLPAEVARTALSAAQARILTVPATLEGIASTHAVLEWMRGLPRDITTSTVVVLTETVPHTGLHLEKAAEQLKATGASVRVLPYDRHLAAGGTIRTELLARDTREAAARLAAEAFQLSHRRR